MNNVISFSLWGNDPKYCVGAIQNAKLAQEIYPGWTCRFYCGSSVPYSYIEDLGKMPNVQVVEMEQEGNWTGMFWRFMTASSRNVDVSIFRDCDSRLSWREREAVNDWLRSDFDVHIMRDHPWHTSPIMGGMWGIKKGVIPNLIYMDKHQTIKGMVNNAFMSRNYWQVDQEFLSAKVWPLIKNKALIHDAFYADILGGQDFPQPRRGDQFVGQVFDEHENTPSDHIELLHQGAFQLDR
jgi:hypothetical protein